MAGPGDLTGEQLQYFGAIQAAARVHATTAETWDAIRGQAAATGTELPAGMFSAVNAMRSLATGLRNGAEAIAAASPTDAITGDMLGRQPYAIDRVAELVTSYDVRFQVTVATPDGTTEDRWYLRQYPAGLPATVGDLYADLNDYAGLIGTKYQVGVVGEVSAVEIGWF